MVSNLLLVSWYMVIVFKWQLLKGLHETPSLSFSKCSAVQIIVNHYWFTEMWRPKLPQIENELVITVFHSIYLYNYLSNCFVTLVHFLPE